MFKYFLLGLVAGLALGVALAVLFNLSGNDGTRTFFPDTVNVNYKDEELKSHLGELSKAVSKLTQSIQFMPKSNESIRIARNKKGAVESDLLDSSKTMKGSVDWAKVINSDLAKALIENAMTPYDPGVSPILEEAAKMLKEAKNQYYKSDKENQSKYEKAHADCSRRYSHVRRSGDPEWESYSAEKKDIDKNYKEERERIRSKLNEEEKRILETFRSALKSLKGKD